jgi:hypothetical protein
MQGSMSLLSWAISTAFKWTVHEPMHFASGCDTLWKSGSLYSLQYTTYEWQVNGALFAEVEGTNAAI